MQCCQMQRVGGGGVCTQTGGSRQGEVRVARAHLMARGRVDKALRRLELDHVLGRAAPVAGDLELGKPAQGWAWIRG